MAVVRCIVIPNGVAESTVNTDDHCVGSRHKCNFITVLSCEVGESSLCLLPSWDTVPYAQHGKMLTKFPAIVSFVRNDTGAPIWILFTAAMARVTS